MWSQIHRQFAALPNRADPALVWSALFGALCYGAYLLWREGAWWRLNNADSTGITQITVLLFLGATCWCGARAFTLSRQLHASAAALPAAQSWAGEYLQRVRGADNAAQAAAQAHLADSASGAHEAVWWINGVLLKLGLLGTVAGFVIMAFQIAGLDAFDIAQAQQLMKRMTGGMAIALLTTLVGLTGNIVLGLQLLLLDRAADRVVDLTLLRAHIGPSAAE